MVIYAVEIETTFQQLDLVRDDSRVPPLQLDATMFAVELVESDDQL